ncbi:fumarylacetoacetate hydrolase family protein [Paraburkholderia megapolitana]|uniref:fumarylacetoacetate hydrolase family protein n=1 Tax=Paraburkholderia megapolitana TaxID=420953 RepID=UPI0038BB6844
MVKTEDYVFAPPHVSSVAIKGSDKRFPVHRIYCVGRNYAEHVREMGGDERQKPFFFQKPADSIVEDGAAIRYPSGTVDFQHEIELVLAIGRGGTDIEVEEAAGHIFGLTVGIDLTRRDLQVEARQAGRPWEIGKSFDHSAPIAAIVPLNGEPLPGSGVISLHVNGQLRQRGDLAEMIWNPAEIVSQLSRQYALKGGDLIFTGTPAGVGPMVAGDEVAGELEGIGSIRVAIVAA